MDTPVHKAGDLKGLYLSCAEFHSWKLRATVAFLGLALISSGAAFWAWSISKDSDNALERSAKQAVYNGCLGRASGRIDTATSLDDIRLQAVRPNPDKTEVKSFIERTQPSLDRQLSKAAGFPVRTEGKLGTRELNPVENAAETRCRAVASRFKPDRSGEAP